MHVPGLAGPGMRAAARRRLAVRACCRSRPPRCRAVLAPRGVGGVSVAWALACIVVAAGGDLRWRRGGFAAALLTCCCSSRSIAIPARARSAALKYLVIGVGGLFTYDLFLYSQAQLLGGTRRRELERARHRQRACGAADRARRPPPAEQRPARVRLAPGHVLHHHVPGRRRLSAGDGGRRLRHPRSSAASWGEPARGVFLVGAFARARRARDLGGDAPARARLPQQAFLSQQVRLPRRVAALHQDAVGQRRANVQRASVRAVAQSFRAPGGMLFMREESGRRFVPVAAWPLALGELASVDARPREDDMLASCASGAGSSTCRNAPREPGAVRRRRAARLARRRPRCASSRRSSSSTRWSGFFVLFDPPPPFELTFEDRDLLKTVGRHVATQLAQHEADRRSPSSPVRGLQPADGVHDARPEELRRAALAGRGQRGETRHNPEFIDDAIGTIANTSSA